jgi:hypothetical protein
VGCPKRDLYLLATCYGAPPVSLVLASASLAAGAASLGDESSTWPRVAASAVVGPPSSSQQGASLVRSVTDDGAGAASGRAGQQLVLYVGVSSRLPSELLAELQTQAQLLAKHVLAPLFARSVVAGSLAEEWRVLSAKCALGSAAVGLGLNSPLPRPAAGTPGASLGGAGGAGTQPRTLAAADGAGTDLQPSAFAGGNPSSHAGSDPPGSMGRSQVRREGALRQWAAPCASIARVSSLLLRAAPHNYAGMKLYCFVANEHDTGRATAACARDGRVVTASLPVPPCRARQPCRRLAQPPRTQASR